MSLTASDKWYSQLKNPLIFMIRGCKLDFNWQKLFKSITYSDGHYLYKLTQSISKNT